MKRKTVLIWIIKQMKNRIPALILMTALDVLAALAGVYFALSTKNVVNFAVSGDSAQLYRAILVLGMCILGVLLFRGAFRLMNHYLLAQLDADWKKKLLAQLLNCDYENIYRMHSGEMMNRLNNDVRYVSEGVVEIFPGLAAMASWVIANLVALFAMDWRFALALLAIGSLLYLISAGARSYLRRLNRQISEADGQVMSFFQESLENIMPVQAMGMEQEICRRGGKFLEIRYLLQKSRGKLIALTNTALNVFGYVMGFVALVWCAVGIHNGVISFGELTAITQLVSQLQGPMVSLSGVIPKYSAMITGAQRLMELEQLCAREEDNPEEIPEYDQITHICAENLSFSYDRDLVLKNAEFALPAGAFCVVTGTSGAGKSTILRLMLDVFHPDQGRIYLKTAKSERILDRSTRSLFAYVPQGNLLFSGTVRENLLLVRPNATAEQVEQAVYASGMDLFLATLPDGLDTVLGENGSGLSEGQAQRLAIARGVLVGAPILLLDEATSALDVKTEAIVLERLRELPNKTCIAVTHRQAAAALADWQIIVSKKGITCKPIVVKE